MVNPLRLKDFSCKCAVINVDLTEQYHRLCGANLPLSGNFKIFDWHRSCSTSDAALFTCLFGCREKFTALTEAQFESKAAFSKIITMEEE